jgi:hypothetical protein
MTRNLAALTQGTEKLARSDLNTRVLVRSRDCMSFRLLVRRPTIRAAIDTCPVVLMQKPFSERTRVHLHEAPDDQRRAIKHRAPPAFFSVSILDNRFYLYVKEPPVL